MKACGLLAAAGLTVRALALPGGMDPDDFIKTEGLAAFNALAERAHDFIRFYVEMSGSRTTSIEGRRDVAFELFEMLAALEDDILRDEYVKHVARAMGLNEWSVRKSYQEFQQRNEERARLPRQEEQEPVETPLNRDDCDFIAALLAHDEICAQARSMLAATPLPAGALGVVLDAVIHGRPATAAHAEDAQVRRLYAAATNLEAKNREEAAALVEKRIRRMELDALRAQAGALHREIIEAERAGDTIRQFELIKRKADVEKQMQRVGAA
jgi:DNA primase